jgi:hypothetical protein
MRLNARIVAKPDLGKVLMGDLFALYARYYSPVDSTVFAADLARKSYCITLTDDQGQVCGFSTVQHLSLQTSSGEIAVLFSGDTVIDRPWWGEQTLPFAWIEQAGRIKAQSPETPLYWLLITKGHRTFRYLPAFAKLYHPQMNTTESLRDLTEEIATQVFGSRFDQTRGVLCPDVTCPTALRPEFHGLDVAHSQNPQVQFFVSQNPGYALGEELVCLCELSAENLRPWALRQFRKGLG